MPSNAMLARIRAEYLEMPGLRLTLEQAQRLYGVERTLCRQALNTLVDVKFLCLKSDGAYARLTDGDDPHPCLAKADLIRSLPRRQQTAEGVVALFNASNDTFEMIETLLKENGGQTLIWGHFADLKRGNFDFTQYLAKHDPEVVIFDITPPYDENWQFFRTMRDSDAMRGRGSVLTTTNKTRLDEVSGTDSHALEVVGRPKDLQQIGTAIAAATRKAQGARLALA